MLYRSLLLVLFISLSIKTQSINYGSNWWHRDAIVALDAEGRVYMRGLKIPDSHKMPEGLEGVKEVFSTLYSFAALHLNGSVTVWGDVTRGGCNGESPRKTYYTCFPKDPAPKVKTIFANQVQFVALTEDDTVFMWGRVPSIDIPAGLSGVKMMYNNVYSWVAISHNDSVIGLWGSETTGGSRTSGKKKSTVWYGLYEDLTDVVSVQSTVYSFLALKKDSTIWTWGRQYAAKPSKDNTTGVVSMSSSKDAFAVIFEDRHVEAWGLSHHGGVLEESITDVRSLFSTDTAMAALHMTGEVTCWGSPGYGGQCKGLTNVKQIFGGPLNFLALLEDGTSTFWGHGAGFYNPRRSQSRSHHSMVENGRRDLVMALNGKYTNVNLRSNGTVFTTGPPEFRAEFPTNLTGVINVFGGDTVHAALTASGTLAYAEAGHGNNEGVRASTADAFPGAKIVTVFASTVYYPDSTVRGLYPCGWGTYGPNFGNCTACPSGSPKPRGRPGFRSSIDSCIRCPPGNFSDDGVSCSQQCPAGSMRAPYDYFGNIDSSLRINHCEMCIPGYFSSHIGASKCTTCPGGKHSASYGALKCDNCEAGKFATAGSGACTPCPLNDQGLNTTALPGEAFVETDCYQICPPGMFATKLNGPCGDCFPGTYSTTSGANSCLRCPKGQYKSSYGQGECSYCSPGSYSDVEGAPNCFLCPGGKYLPESGADSPAACLDCVKGYYSFPGSTKCRLTPPGSYTNESCSSDSILCPAGKYQKNSGATECQLASPGHYAPQGSAVAVSCPGGTFVPTNGSTSESDCTTCQSGTYSTEGASACTPCQKDDYAPQEGMRACKSCKADEGYLMTGSPDRTRCVKDDVLASSLAGVSFVQLLFDRGAGLYGSAIIASVFVAAGVVITLVREKYFDQLSQRRRIETVIHTLQAGFSFGSEMFLVAGLFNSAHYAHLGAIILLSRTFHFFVGCLLALLIFKEDMGARIKKLTLAEGLHDLHKHLDLEISRIKSGITGLVTFLSLCDVTMISFLPYKKSLFVETSKGYCSISMLKLCIFTKVLQSFISMVCQSVFIAENQSAGARGSNSAAALIFFYSSIMATAFSVGFGGLLLALKGELLGKLEKVLEADKEKQKEENMEPDDGVGFWDIYKRYNDDDVEIPTVQERKNSKRTSSSERLKYALNPLFGGRTTRKSPTNATADRSESNEDIEALRKQNKTLSEQLDSLKQEGRYSAQAQSADHLPPVISDTDEESVSMPTHDTDNSSALRELRGR